jgi:hypothetical protein
MSRLHDRLTGTTKKRSVKPWNPDIKKKDTMRFPKELQEIIDRIA